ncbi:MAG TPA: YggS family pyridoxal phosphate-dependent enzyme [Candidatus Limnocylindria bacterium]|nr:YggS family pyridoxal phosphate-dependent enzyme [Candidatus Limnocylindria bacterium]
MQPIEEPPLSLELVSARLASIEARLRHAAAAAGQDPAGFRIVAVTKGFGLEAVRAALGAGLRCLGESRVQEALPKVEAEPGAEWHLIGRLQANKVRLAVRAFAVIHAVDSLELLVRTDRISGEEGRAPRLLLEVNLSGESTKAGFPASWFGAQAAADGELVHALRGVSHAQPAGLMTIAPLGVGVDQARACFATLRGLRDALQRRVGPLPELSMGMTADADAAVAEGATLVRIGTGLFGPRPG